MLTVALTCLAALAVGALVVVAVLFVYARILAAGRPDPVDAAYHSLPAGRPELRINTATGSHDAYPQMTDNVRRIVTDYCEAMWQRTVNGDPK